MQFDSAPYVRVWNLGRDAEADNKRRPFENVSEMGKTLTDWGDSVRKNKLQDYFMSLKQQESDRQNDENTYKFGTPIDPNIMVAEPQGNAARSRFMPTGMGQVASSSPLVDAHKKWLAGGMQPSQARPEFMDALGQDERKQYQEKFDPLRLAMANAKLNPPDKSDDETYSIAGVDADGNIIQIGNKTGTRRVVSNGGAPLYPKDATDAQANAAGFGDRAVSAHQQIEDLFTEKNPTLNQNSLGFATQESKITPNFVKSGNIQGFDQSKRNFLNAILRRESGAVISPSEFEEGNKQYFPVYGDTTNTIRQKAANRQMQISNLRRSAGPLATKGGGSGGGGMKRTIRNKRTGETREQISNDGGQTWQ